MGTLIFFRHHDADLSSPPGHANGSIKLKLNSEIIVEQNIKSQYFTFTRNYHSKGKLKTDTIECKVIGIDPPKAKTNATIQTVIQSNETLPETLIKIEGCDSFENACQIKNCLRYFGEVLSEVTENTHCLLINFTLK